MPEPIPQIRPESPRHVPDPFPGPVRPSSAVAQFDQSGLLLQSCEVDLGAPAPHWLDALHETCRFLQRGNAIDLPVLREPYAQLLCKEIENFRRRIYGFHELLRTEFGRAADQWLKMAEKQLLEAQAVAKKEPCSAGVSRR